ncbi:hypothetical protein PAT3040_02193 [Paenibacillus agaridevorans]|uniref:Uncharacterized protein n=1 Tax=Paenibacillus agaridevorans TaxID=171404 RepID=A0A2R5EM51_9BACL|nr:hypothetical protein [Paenibacillus agaridevorans]GBG07637.1 hypothetical protein PAT3040_02193 [Paenibacillus agaridevorans]
MRDKPFVSVEGIEQKLDGSTNPTEDSPIRKMELGKSLYIVQCHYIGNETIGDKIERLVLRTWEGEASRNR